MTDAVIKQVPDVMAKPVAVMRSRMVSDRFTMFGDLFDDNGAPVLVVLDPNPTINGSYDVDVIGISSAYGKDTQGQRFIDNSDVLFVDKARADEWGAVSRLYLPLTTNPIGSTESIAQNGDTVNGKYEERR